MPQISESEKLPDSLTRSKRQAPAPSYGAGVLLTRTTVSRTPATLGPAWVRNLVDISNWGLYLSEPAYILRGMTYLVEIDPNPPLWTVTPGGIPNTTPGYDDILADCYYCGWFDYTVRIAGRDTCERCEAEQDAAAEAEAERRGLLRY